MNVKNLSTTSFDTILECFLSAFDNYYVKMPTDPDYYKARWKAAKVNFNLSYGMFDSGKLVGFIIHAIDHRAGMLTAFNTGTGVIPEYRGRKILNAIYDYVLTDLSKNGITKSTLEVIRANEIAIHCYERVGFKICKKYKCFTGTITMESNEQFEVKEVAFEHVDWSRIPNQQYYSWDFQQECLTQGNYKFFQVFNNNTPESFFIIHPENKYVGQLDLLNNEGKGWERLFAAIKKVSEHVKVINIDERLKEKLANIALTGLKNTINQYEMELYINV